MKTTSPTLPGQPPKAVVFLSPSAVDITGVARVGASSQRISHHTFTIYHLIILLAISIGFAAGLAGGTKLCGIAGGIAGGLIGGYLGFMVGRLPEQLVLQWLSSRLACASTDELRSFLRNPACQIQNLVLLELQRRGENIRQELGVILDLLGSEDVSRRGHGWAALSSAFPDLARQIDGYRLGDSVDECRRKTKKLR